MFKGKGKLCYVEAEVVNIDRKIVHGRNRTIEKLSVIFRDKNGRTHHFYTVSTLVSDVGGTVYYVTTSGRKLRLYEGDKGVLACKRYDNEHEEYVDFFRGMTQEHIDLLSGKKPNAS